VIDTKGTTISVAIRPQQITVTHSRISARIMANKPFETFHYTYRGNDTARFAISGPDCQILSINLPTHAEITCEPGSMMFMHPSIKSRVECGNCSRTCAGEALCKVIYKNEGNGDAYVALTPNFPAKVVPIHLTEVGGKMIAKSGAYMASLDDVSVTADFDCCSLNCCFGGMGFIRQALSGTGTLFMAAGGTIVTKTLAPQEVIVVDTDSIVGFQESVQLGIRRAGGCCMCCCGGEGMFNSTLTGPGLVVLQSMSFEKYRRAVAPPNNNQDPENPGVQ